ncbi:ferritin-like domain-containing protein [Paraburkholderia dinghuensis]|uniref:Rubrerythrin diiron-binding domain-containing protein n=1 Tax=Paraburkholderia dinghuensis TaxID=2305225 RepID=A0A3N6N7H3_9BURK|nr:ferritin family protein [Paraburkholderia dinghuensis]RQH04882.1 hypothetical protein D1Y85_15790 [Paraburkholderia dinghuensis]
MTSFHAFLVDSAGRSLRSLFAYARDMERATAERYTQLADMLSAHHNDQVAALFKRLADIEWVHVYEVSALCVDMGVPEDVVQSRPTDRLRGAELPDPGELHYLTTPYQAIELAYRGEQRAALFYEDVARTTPDAEVRELAQRFAEEERRHMRELDVWRSRYPPPAADWDDDPDPANEPE